MSNLKKFEELNLLPEIQNVLNEMEFLVTTEIQSESIPILLRSEKNFVGQAQTGTGKSFAFLIPLICKIKTSDQNVQSIILTPTRELAIQLGKEVEKLTKYMEIQSCCVYGGVPASTHIKALREKRPQIVIGTPGRTVDLIKQNKLKLSSASFCILDEADEMLSMGFSEEVDFILDQLKNSAQLVMFSATMPGQVLKVIQSSFGDYDEVKITQKELGNKNIIQKYFVVREKHFKEGLARLIDSADYMYGIVFCRTKLEAKDVCDDLKKRGESAQLLIGDMGQMERDHAMSRFRTKKSKILVCTDVAARGIDIQNITHVFNYGAPRDNESYVHRIGRTARAGEEGFAYTLIGPKSLGAIKSIEKHTKQKMRQDKLPSVAKLKEIMVERELVSSDNIALAIKEKGEEFKAEEAFHLVKDRYSDMSKEDLIKLMFVWKFNKEMRRYNNLADIETDNSEKKTSPKKNKSKRSFGKKERG